MTHHLGALAEQAAERGGLLIFEGVRHPAQEAWNRSIRLAGGLRAAGVQPGDRVVVLMANGPEVPEAYAAIWWAGAVVTPVVFLVSVDELAHILRDAEPAAVLTSAEFASKVAATGLAVPTYVVGDASYADLLAGPPSPLVDRSDDDLAALMYTGGTTGRAKGVMLSHAGLWETGRAAYQHTYEPDVTIGLSALPLAHAYGLIVTVSGLHATQAPTAILQRWFAPTAFLALAEQHRVQRISAVPSMLQLLLAEPLESYDLSALRVVGSGASPLAISVIEAWERRVPSSQICEGYGLTESSAVVAANRPGRRRVGSVGTALPGLALRIEDPRGEELPAGEDGEICVSSVGVMTGYWRSSEHTEEALRGGFLHTGDIGHVDPDGYLYVVDRLKDLIIRNGFNVYPRDVEDVLLAYPGVVGAAVVGRPDPVVGEEVVAFIAVSEDPATQQAPDEAAVLAYAHEHLAATKYPRQIRRVAQIPLTSVGKTDRKALRALAQELPS